MLLVSQNFFIKCEVVFELIDVDKKNMMKKFGWLLGFYVLGSTGLIPLKFDT